MMTGPSYFEIQADDLDRAAQFYGELFDWKFVEAEGTPVEYWRIETGGIRGGLLARPAKAPGVGSGANAFVCSIQVEDFDATAKVVLQLGGKVALPKFAVPGTCWQGYFLDPEGNVFGLFQADSNAR